MAVEMEDVMQLALDRFGRMVLPKALRDDFGLIPGALLDVEEQQECIVLRPVREQAVVKQRDGLLVYTGKATGDLRNAVTDHRLQRTQHAWTQRGGA